MLHKENRFFVTRVTYYHFNYSYFCADLYKLKIILSFGFSLIYVLHILKAPAFYAYYELDAKGFIEQLCENKDQPELACNGKCFLNKVSETKSSDDSNTSTTINWEELLFYVPFEKLEKTLSIKIQIKHLYFYKDLLQQGEAFDIFHPPKTQFT